MNAEFKIDPEFKLLLPPLTTEEYSELEKSLLGGKGPRPVLIPVFLTQGGHDVPNRQFRMLLPDLRHGSARHGKPVLDFPDFINHLVAESAMAKKFWQCLFRICVSPIPVASPRRSPRLRVRKLTHFYPNPRPPSVNEITRHYRKRRSLSSNPLARSTIGTSSFKKTVHKNSGVSAFPCTFHTSL